MELIEQRDPVVPLAPACDALGLSRAAVYRHKSPRKHGPRRRPSSPRKLAGDERAKVLAELHSERFADQTPSEVYGTLLEEGAYHCSVRTMYRVLAEQGETRERRDQRPPAHHAVPRLEASRPNSVWTWDITKLPTHVRGVFLNLYVVLDLYSRYVVAWMVAERENSALAKQLFADAIERYDITPGTLKVHMDRGAPMTAHGLSDLLGECGVDKSHSRPRISNDNPFVESCFKTVKYQPDYPGRFANVVDARAWCAEFFDWYNDAHRHHGLALFTPADVYFGRVDELAAARQRTLDAAFEAHPERFVRGRPVARRPPSVVHINPLVLDDALVPVENALSAPDETWTRNESTERRSPAPHIALPGVARLRGGAASATILPS